MKFYGGSIGAGYNAALNDISARDRSDQEVARSKQLQRMADEAMEQQRADRARSLQYDQNAANTLQGLMAPPPVSPQQPPGGPPGQASQPSPRPPMPPQQPGLGSGIPPAPMPMAGPPPQQGAPMPQPMRPPAAGVPMPGAGASTQAPPMGMTSQPNPPMAPPSGAPPQPQQPPMQPQGQQQQPTVQGVIAALKAKGVPPDQWMGTLERLKPVFDQANREELADLKHKHELVLEETARYKQKLADINEGRLERVAATGERRADAAEKNANTNARKADAIIAKLGREPATGAKGWKEFTDGKTIYRDNVNAGVTQKKVDGKWEDVDQLPPGVKPVGAKEGGGQQTAVRAQLVQAGAKNAVARLDEIEKTYGNNATTSVMFGAHPEGPITAGMYGAGRGMQSAKQQKIDAQWASLIDEAIPVYTGGLRGSDSFRRFLMSQVPQPGDKPAVVAEKKRLIRANIDGTSKVFANKFRSDPAMWAAGEKPDDAEVTPGGGGGWKVERVK